MNNPSIEVVKTSDGQGYTLNAHNFKDASREQLGAMVDHSAWITEHVNAMIERLVESCEHEWDEPYPDWIKTGNRVEVYNGMSGWNPDDDSEPEMKEETIRGYSRKCKKCWHIESRRSETVEVSPFSQ